MNSSNSFYGPPSSQYFHLRRVVPFAPITRLRVCPAAQADPPSVPPKEKVGLQKDGSVLLPDSQVILPAGRQFTVIGRPGVMAIRLVTEDDAQDGVDHVDGHRTQGSVISPFVKRNLVDSSYYNQVSMVRTIEQILGLPPMNQHDLITQPMRALFTNTPDYTAYTALPENIKLNTLTPQSAATTSKLQRAWQKESAAMFARPQKADSANPELLNHAIWYATKGFDKPYPGDKKVLLPEEVSGFKL